MRTSEDQISAPKRPSKRILALDGIRGIAVLVVMLLHVGVLPPGWVGVNVFFGLSGYLITGILLDGADSGASRTDVLRAFYIRRALRIFPLAFLVALIVGVVSRSGFSTLWSVSYIQNWFIYPIPPRALGHYWTLAVEEQFYFLWPFVILITPRSRLPWICLGLLGLGFTARAALYYVHTPFDTEHFLRTATVVAADCLSAGSLLAIAERRGWLGAYRRYFLPVFAAALVVLAVLAWWSLARRYLGPVYILRETSLAVAVGTGLAWALLAAPTWLGHPALRYVGSISYGLYVIHGAIAVWVYSMALPWRVLLVFGGAFPLAALSWRYFESPILRQKWRWPMPTRPTDASPVVLAANAAEPDPAKCLTVDGGIPQ